jgi:protein TonB
MFGTLLASGAPRQPITRPAVIAGLLHLIIVVGAVRLTASVYPASRPAPRDTIPFQLDLPHEPTRSDWENRPGAPLEPAPQPLGEPPLPPPLELASPFDTPDWRGLVRVDTGGQSTELMHAADPIGPRFSTSEVDELPELLGALSPPYPEQLRRAGVNGLVRVEYVILPSGRADSASVRVIASTEPAFTTSVISALLSASFKPARRRGRPVAVLVQQTVRFQNR